MKLTSSSPTGILPTPSSGSNYQITFTGDWDGATASLDIWDSITAEFVPTTAGIFQDGGQTTANLSATGPMIRATLSGADTATDLEFSVEHLGAVTSPLMTDAILDHIKGAKADLVNGKVPDDQMPDSLTVDYVVVGELDPDMEAPEGALARKGTALVMYDADGNPVTVGADGAENFIPYRRVSGVAHIIPFGVSGSRVKRAGLKYWQEIARVKIPGTDLANGNSLRFISEIHVKSTTAISALAPSMILVPAEKWDIADQTTYFGASPTLSDFNAITPNYFGHFQAASTSLESTSRTQRTHVVGYSGGLFFIAPVSSGTYQYGYNWTGAAAFTGSGVSGLAGFAREDQTDLELVLVANSSGTSTDFRVIHFDVSFQATEP